jgi:hypothetical protein
MMSLALSIHRSRGNAYRVSAPNSNSLLIQALSFARERVSCLANGAVHSLTLSRQTSLCFNHVCKNAVFLHQLSM